MVKVQAYLFIALLMSGAALAQDDTQASEDSQEKTQKTEVQDTLASEERMEEKQQDKEKQTASSDKKSDENFTSDKNFMTKQAEDQIRSDQLAGSDVVNASDEKIGSISNLIVDKDGQIVGIIVGVGGFLGMGEKHVALSWDAVEITTAEGQANYQVKTSISKEDLDNAEAYKTEERQQSDQQLEQQQAQPESQMGQPQGQEQPEE